MRRGHVVADDGPPSRSTRFRPVEPPSSWSADCSGTLDTRGIKTMHARLTYRWFALCLLAACGGDDDGGSPADAGPGVDGSSATPDGAAGPDAAPGAPDGGAPAPFLTEVTCDDPGDPGTGIGAGAALPKVTLDDYPDAVCNDGSPGVMYVRAASAPEFATRWVFHFQGGGGCGADFQTCKDRWCSANNGAGQHRPRMTSASTPEV